MKIYVSNPNTERTADDVRSAVARVADCAIRARDYSIRRHNEERSLIKNARMGCSVTITLAAVKDAHEELRRAQDALRCARSAEFRTLASFGRAVFYGQTPPGKADDWAKVVER